MGIGNDPKCRKCGTEETSVHILCECDALASLGYIYLGSFFLVKRYSSPVTGPEGPRGFQEVKVPRLRDNGTGWW